jgi:hypothetical protein
VKKNKKEGRKMRKIVIGSILGLLVLLGVGLSYNHGKQIAGDDIFYMVSHSEYWSDEQGQVIARLYDWQGAPITVDNCTVDIYNPDKTSFVSNALTTDTLQTTTGTHYYVFTTPTVEGIYQYMVTCNYDGKSRGVASTFHLSPALDMLRVINDTTITLSSNVDNYFNTVQLNLSNINDDLFSITTNTNTILVNLTSIRDDTNYIRNNMLTSTVFNTNITTVVNNQNTIINQGNNILNNLTAIEAFCGTQTTNGSTLCLWVDEIRGKITDINLTLIDYTAILNEINQTTHSTYDYMTVTLATNVNNIYNTVTRIETNTVQINETANAIRQNQEDAVWMEVTS